ncbi:MAG: hypothetical protein MZV64_59475 [Ignavibacteriales bacterium]|nr:hypothetical protein [Ignavibacteriales bacterium]
MVRGQSDNAPRTHQRRASKRPTTILIRSRSSEQPALPHPGPDTARATLRHQAVQRGRRRRCDPRRVLL